MGLPLAKYTDQLSTRENSGDQPEFETREPEGTAEGRREANRLILALLRSTVANPIMLRFSDIADFVTRRSSNDYSLNGGTSTSYVEGAVNGNTPTHSNLVRQDILDVLPPLPEGIPLLYFFEIFYSRVGGPGQTSVEEFSELVADTCNIDGGMVYRKE
ncbi:hypothetical protein DL765_008565 [Monosporascus sp. GIB2]|nr:hypothetical protein DL765_008565 [Monosporascus sp. GIB2]